MRHAKLTGILLAAGLAVGAIGASTVAASARPHHPPGPDRCWAWVWHHHHHRWVWICPRPYSPLHPEIGFYLNFDDGHHHHHIDWKKDHPGDGMGGYCEQHPDKCHKK
jgi:hypothetical protein